MHLTHELAEAIQLHGLQESIYYTYNGQIIPCREMIPLPSKTICVFFRLRGGKGGFGSMLRHIGSQIEKTTNREACRDLTGRRMRDVNNERRLQEWLGKAGEREKERLQKQLERRRKRRQLLLNGPGKVMRNNKESKLFQQQTDTIQKNLDAAIVEAIQLTRQGACGSEMGSKSEKKTRTACRWLDDDEGEELLQQEENVSAVTETPGCLPSCEEKGDDATEQGPASSSPQAQEEEDDDEAEFVLNYMEKAILEEVEEEHSPGTGKEDQAENAVVPEQAISEEINSIKPSSENTSKNKRKRPNVSVPEGVELRDLSIVNGQDDLREWGLEVLKEQLLLRGLKCGGSLDERAERLWSVKDLSPEEYPPHVKPNQPQKRRGK